MKVFDMNEPAYSEWVASRPLIVQEMIRKWPPNILFRLKTTGQRVVVIAYNESGTVTVDVLEEFNPERPYTTNRRVFGINPHDLEECDLPTEHVN